MFLMKNIDSYLKNKQTNKQTKTTKNKNQILLLEHNVFNEIFFETVFFSVPECTRVDVAGNTLSQTQTKTILVHHLQTCVGGLILREEGHEK